MARYTGPKFKLSRRLGISLSGTGKELAKRPFLQVSMVLTNGEKSATMVCDFKKSKSVTCTAWARSNLKPCLTKQLA